MAALNFPNGPSPGDKYPVSPIAGIPQYTWDGEKWTTTGAQVTNATPSATIPLVDATPGLAGTAAAYSRGDHVHPTDTSRAALAYVDGNMVAYNAAQTTTVTQRSQARANIHLMKRNYIINGGMQVSQENGTTAGVTNGYSPVDMFIQTTAVTLTTTVQQIASATPGGSPYRVRATCTGTDAAPAATHFWTIRVAVEGLRAADLRSGAASAKTITIQFGVKAPAGTYYVSIQNAGQLRSYPASYIIAAGEANTDVVKSVTLTLDTTGTWVTDNTVGMYIFWALASGANRKGTPNTWQANEILCGSDQFNLMSPAGNVFELFDVSLTEGTVAPPFQLPDYASELALCMRYFRRTTGEGGTEPTHYGWGDTGASVGTTFIYPVPMRANPTITLTGTWIVTGSANTQPSIVGQNATSCGLYITGNLTGRISFQPNNSGRVAFNARL